MKNYIPALVFLSLASCLLPASALAADRDVLVCTSATLPPELKQAVSDFTARAGNTPLLRALRAAGESGAVAPQDSEQLLAPKSYDRSAHNHLIVIGLPATDPLLQKVWGFTVTLNETNKTIYSQGWGHLQGDIGWIECDRNPFLHSNKIKAAPEDTILVKISGTSAKGVLAALRAFEGGLLGGLVPAGPVGRPEQTLLDRNPDPAPPPGTLPPTVQLPGGKSADLAGWYDVPESEYRAVEEAAGVSPTRMWRCKYLAPGILEEKSIVRWFGGVHRMAFGNAGDIIKFGSPDEARLAAEKMSKRENFKKVAGQQDAWMEPQATDETIEQAYWNIYLTHKGSYVLLSTLPVEGTAAIADAIAGR